jgi:hypothetical protein
MRVDRVQELWDIEQIKKLKSRYFQYLDTKRWDDMRQLFVDNCQIWHAEGPNDYAEGADTFISEVANALEGTVTVHQGHMADVEITGPNDAEGVWAMYGYGRWPDGGSHQGWGHYRETYRRGVDGKWRIATLKLTKLLRVTDDPESAKQRGGEVKCPEFTKL